MVLAIFRELSIHVLASEEISIITIQPQLERKIYIIIGCDDQTLKLTPITLVNTVTWKNTK